MAVHPGRLLKISRPPSPFCSCFRFHHRLLPSPDRQGRPAGGGGREEVHGIRAIGRASHGQRRQTRCSFLPPSLRPSFRCKHCISPIRWRKRRISQPLVVTEAYRAGRPDCDNSFLNDNNTICFTSSDKIPSFNQSNSYSRLSTQNTLIFCLPWGVRWSTTAFGLARSIISS